MSVRDRLAAKSRRRVVVPVDVGQPTDEELLRVAEAESAQLSAQIKGDAEAAAAASAAVDAASQRYRLRLEFEALPPEDFEAVVAAYPAGEGEDGGVDYKVALPVLAAECAVDEELRDEGWWRDQLGSGQWSAGERLRLWRALFVLNASAPDPYIPKG